MAVKLQPPSGSELPAFNPILPPAAVTQILLLANPNKVNQDCGGVVISPLVLMSESYLVLCRICSVFQTLLHKCYSRIVLHDTISERNRN